MSVDFSIVSFRTPSYITCPHGLQRDTGCTVIGNNCSNLANALVAESALMETEAPITTDLVSVDILVT